MQERCFETKTRINDRIRSEVYLFYTFQHIGYRLLTVGKFLTFVQYNCVFWDDLGELVIMPVAYHFIRKMAIT
jgi:hypothetical protein